MAADLNLLQLIDLAGDAIASQFTIRFPDTSFWAGIPGMPANFDPRELSLRMDQSFDPPTRSLGTYEYYYQGLKVVRTSMQEQTDKQFTLQFRMDENYKIYQAFNAWYRYSFNDITAVAAPDKAVRTYMVVEYYGPETVPAVRTTYQGVKIMGLKIGTPDPSAADPMRAEVQFTYYYQEDDFTPRS